MSIVSPPGLEEGEKYVWKVMTKGSIKVQRQL
jgi:hypothetical protein